MTDTQTLLRTLGAGADGSNRPKTILGDEYTGQKVTSDTGGSVESGVIRLVEGLVRRIYTSNALAKYRCVIEGTIKYRVTSAETFAELEDLLEAIDTLFDTNNKSSSATKEYYLDYSLKYAIAFEELPFTIEILTRGFYTI